MANIVHIMDRVVGAIFILGGIQILFLTYGPLPKEQVRKEEREIWRRKYGKMTKILSPIIIISGILFLLGIY